MRSCPAVPLELKSEGRGMTGIVRRLPVRDRLFSGSHTRTLSFLLGEIYKGTIDYSWRVAKTFRLGASGRASRFHDTRRL